MKTPNPEGLNILEQLGSMTDADPRDMGSMQISQVRDFLNTDLFAFNWFIFQHQDLIPSLHGEICDILNKWGYVELEDGTITNDPPDDAKIKMDFRRLMIQIPREFFKTSVVTRANALWQICREPNRPVCIFNERLENSKKWLRSIREVVEGSILFQVVYQDLLPPGKAAWDTESTPRQWKWSDEYLQFQRSKIGIPEPSLTAMGVGAASAGGHWDKIIKDDLISEDAVRSASEMQFAKDWFDKSIYLERPATKGMDLIVCTPWMYGDVYDYVLETYNYTLYRRSALEDADGMPSIKGESIFPQKLSTKALRNQHERDPFGFWSQMQCHPKSGEDTNFDSKWFKGFMAPVQVMGQTCTKIDAAHYDPTRSMFIPERAPQEVPLHWITRAVLLDPATARKSQKHAEKFSRHGLVCAGMDPWGRRYVFDAVGFRKDPEDTLREVIAMCVKWKTPLVAIEEVIFSEVYRHFLDYMMAKEFPDLELIIKPVEPKGRSKVNRNTAMIPMMRQGYYFFRYEGCEQLLQELVEYPNGLTVDIIDSLAYLEDVVDRPETPTELEIIHHTKIVQEEHRDVVTGYSTTM